MTETTDQTNQETLRKHLDRQGRLGQWMSLEAFGWLMGSQERQSANEEAENKWYRKQMAGDAMADQGGDAATETEDMRVTILGDITNNQPQQPQAQQPVQSKSSMLPVATAFLAGMIPAAGLAGYMLSQDEPERPAAASLVDESVSIGLGRIEDYLPKDRQQ